MSLVNEENKTRFFTSFQSLVDYLLENSGIQEEDLPAILEAFLTANLATDTDVLENTNTERVITVSTAAVAARKAIEEWVQLAPDSLDTLQEISTALQNDPEIIQKLFDLLSGKASQSDLDKRQLTSNVDFAKAEWDAFFNWNSAGFNSVKAGIYHGVATAGRLGLLTQYPDVPEDENCNVTVSVSTEQYKIYTLTAANFIGEQVRLPINHLNQIDKVSFTVNEERVVVPTEDIDTESETEILVSNVSWQEGDLISLTFLTHVPMSLTKRVYAAVTTYAQGAEFFRTAKVLNGTLQTENMMVPNVWRSSSMDLEFTIDTIISAINEAIPDDETPQ